MRVLFTTILVLGVQCVQAQVTTASKQPVAKQTKTMATGEGYLNNQSSYQAHGASGALVIADPTINALNRQGYGSRVPLYGHKGVLGLPRGTYGYARGQLWLRSTVATSTGGSTGISSVGTGGSNGGAGVSGSAPGVNGKAPDAGPAIWGSARGLLQPSVPPKSGATASGRGQ